VTSIKTHTKQLCTQLLDISMDMKTFAASLLAAVSHLLKEQKV